MIKEDYVSPETAKLLKEKGFEEECSTLTLQSAMKWLREIHKIFFITEFYQLEFGNTWACVRVQRLNKRGCEVQMEGFDLEELYEKAIKFCLEDII